ncbi:DNA ligase B [Andreprevotia sp. IGB-42]|uniref:ATP-dependent DNA ligase n=1 Tax=Andreprevotia sp. IGB-42 TaxID=2497473 RepID=UPI0013581DA5|nr:ATP-dependent DNA ligase [Andreprevotia sp. IGB-42]KAF0813685.1 DNA ligase B [Andreprevotia sp. IGB-42]
MKQFAALYAELDTLTASNAKLAALTSYFAATPAADAAWAVYFLAGGKPRQVVPAKVLRQAAQAAAGLPEWLFDECYDAVGDLAETISLVLPPASSTVDIPLAQWVADTLLPLRGEPPEVQHAALSRMWQQQNRLERFVGIKLITGSLRVGVSRLLVTRALAAVSGIDAKLVAQRLVGYTAQAVVAGKALPDAAAYLALIAPAGNGGVQRGGQPYPFFLAHPWQQDVAAMAAQLGSPAQWQVEWKWDGIRAQLVKRAGDVWVWSRGEDLVTERFPELQAAGATLPDGTVLDGEILVWLDGQVAPFALLQQRIGRKNLGAKVLAAAPVILLAYDILEWQGVDQRTLPQHARRALLEQVLADYHPPGIQRSPLVAGDDWAQLATLHTSSRARGVEGMMLKARDAAYGIGRTKDVGTWWKWKIDPYSIDAVLIYAQAGHGRRASLYTDYTFAVWDKPQGDATRALVPFAKAYSGLTDEEIRKVDAIVRRTTVEKFGPVRSVTPTLVFELGFEGIAASSRHKSGIAVRFPRMLRWRQDKPVAEADTLADLQMLLQPGSTAANA